MVGGEAWYLSIVGVSRAAQGRGLGAALLQTTLGEADQAAAPCYLETFGEKTWRFYERLGFRRRASHLGPVTGAEYVIMERLPK